MRVNCPQLYPQALLVPFFGTLAHRGSPRRRFVVCDELIQILKVEENNKKQTSTNSAHVCVSITL